MSFSSRHTFDQKRLKQPLYRHPWEDVLYTKWSFFWIPSVTVILFQFLPCVLIIIVVKDSKLVCPLHYYRLHSNYCFWRLIWSTWKLFSVCHVLYLIISSRNFLIELIDDPFILSNSYIFSMICSMISSYSQGFHQYIIDIQWKMLNCHIDK